MPDPLATIQVSTNVNNTSHASNMASPRTKPAGTGLPPVTYINPRRTSPEKSITLKHHRMAREAPRRNAAPKVSIVDSPRRQSSDESDETGFSNPKRWFDRSNENPSAVFDSSMDVDPPFFQKETDSSNEESHHIVPTQSPAYKFVQSRNQGLRPGFTRHSSSADDFRSVIDDLTVENKRLREELKKYKQIGPNPLRGEKLFEVKVHGLPNRRKRELEAALRDFTTSLNGSSTGASPRRKKEEGRGNKGAESSMSKQASSSSGSHSRPHQTDSAYASMSFGPGSSGPSLPGRLSRQRSDQSNIELHLCDVPEGLWPRSSGLMTERDKKTLVVRRLEKLFTGKGLGHTRQPSLPLPSPAIGEEMEMSCMTPDERVALLTMEATREAQILPRSQRTASNSRENASVSNSNGEQTDFREIGSGSRSNDTSPPSDALPEQRPTRPRDLDPDRIQVPSENMDYIRHLGLIAPESRKQYSARDVSPDAEGWVYLNLLGNLAQLHMLNVTPDFIRSAVSEKSKQFQLSPDGRKIRWRGGAENTKFSNDSSGSNSQRGKCSERSTDTDGSNDLDQRKKQRTQVEDSGDYVITSEPSKLVHQVSSSGGGLHYKPLFAHHQTSSFDEQPSIEDDSGSSPGLEESNLGLNSRWNNSGVSGVLQRKRPRDGAIIYYTGAPFCTDLSGDYEISTDSNDVTALAKPKPAVMRGPGLYRTTSGSSIPFKPLSNYVSHRAMMDLDFAPPELSSSESEVSDDIDVEFPWSDTKQSAHLTNLEASGLGGITPDDHFVVTISTRRPKFSRGDHSNIPGLQTDDTAESRDTTESMVARLESMTTGSPLPQIFLSKHVQQKIKMEYVTGKVTRLPPVSLPPPTFFFGSSEDTISESEDSAYESDESGATSKRHVFRTGQTLSNAQFSANDEEVEHVDDADEHDGDGCISSVKKF
ncbi:frequency clock protein [Xylariales sp. AK1849]|nr:frequency clock protein [Xylariales sp. AK1849]